MYDCYEINIYISEKHWTKTLSYLAFSDHDEELTDISILYFLFLNQKKKKS